MYACTFQAKKKNLYFKTFCLNVQTSFPYKPSRQFLHIHTSQHSSWALLWWISVRSPVCTQQVQGESSCIIKNLSWRNILQIFAPETPWSTHVIRAQNHYKLLQEKRNSYGVSNSIGTARFSFLKGHWHERGFSHSLERKQWRQALHRLILLPRWWMMKPQVWTFSLK